MHVYNNKTLQQYIHTITTIFTVSFDFIQSSGTTGSALRDTAATAATTFLILLNNFLCSLTKRNRPVQVNRQINLYKCVTTINTHRHLEAKFNEQTLSLEYAGVGLILTNMRTFELSRKASCSK